MIDEATNQFGNGLGVGVMGYAFGTVAQLMVQEVTGPYFPVLLTAVGFFVYGMFGDARLLQDRKHWFVLGAMVIEILVEPWVLVAGIALLAIGWYIQNRFS
jgi:hypothetical protein